MGKADVLGGGEGIDGYFYGIIPYIIAINPDRIQVPPGFLNAF